jgi:hypothetical protein
MDAVSIVTKASSAIPAAVTATNPLVVAWVLMDAGSGMADTNAMPATITAIKGATAAWKRKTDGKVAAIANASAKPLRRARRLSAIAPAKSQIRSASGIQTNRAIKYMNIGGNVRFLIGFPEQACMSSKIVTRQMRLDASASQREFGALLLPKYRQANQRCFIEMINPQSGSACRS